MSCLEIIDILTNYKIELKERLFEPNFRKLEFIHAQMNQIRMI